MIIVAIRKFKIIIEIKLFLKINKIRTEKIRSKNIGRASKLTMTNVIKKRIIYIIIFFISNSVFFCELNHYQNYFLFRYFFIFIFNIIPFFIDNRKPSSISVSSFINRSLPECSFKFKSKS